MIRTKDLDECIENALIFVERARDLRRLKADEQAERKAKGYAYNSKHIDGFNSQAASVKRASLDLTKALARLRRPWRKE